ncbi:MAG TPA: rhomboid family intramembrane serine protease [Chloroflexota bacterium]|nr:rhomboid family intramembrane serine protease [Chloroflexota bacterium]
MIPVADTAPKRSFPWVTATLALACVLVFAYELLLGPRLDLFVRQWGATPTLVLAALNGDPRVPHAVLWTLLTSQFIHAGWAHLLGNLLYLWVFGRAVEDRLGPLLYLALYLAWGVGAALVQIVLGGPSAAPLVGASGAISGVLGAYLVLFPGAWVSLLVPLFVFFWVFDVPAVLVLGFWFVEQLLSGAATITRASHLSSGVAVWAHVGGFLLGALTGLTAPGPPRAPTAARHPAPRRAPQRGPFWLGASLVATAANAVALLVAVRVLLVLLTSAPRSLLAPLVRAIVALTAPLVEPFVGVLPAVRLDGRVLELYAVAAALAYWAAGALLASLLETAPPHRES